MPTLSLKAQFEIFSTVLGKMSVSILHPSKECSGMCVREPSITKELRTLQLLNKYEGISVTEDEIITFVKFILL